MSFLARRAFLNGSASRSGPPTTSVFAILRPTYGELPDVDLDNAVLPTGAGPTLNPMMRAGLADLVREAEQLEQHQGEDAR